MASLSAPRAQPAALPSLEELANYYGTDKARDDHKYVALYAALFDPIRHTALNVTEVGISMGQSLQMWHDFFSRAHIWGIESRIHSSVHSIFSARHWVERVHVLKGDSRSAAGMAALSLADESMDVIIDDGNHAAKAIELTLLALWRTLRPNGFYCIEDIATGANERGMYNDVHYGQAAGKAEPREGRTDLVHAPDTWSPAVRQILTQHETFFVDTAAGHRDFERFVGEVNNIIPRGSRTALWALDRLNHNSHVLVIRKREVPLTAPLHMNTRSRAMVSGAVRSPLNLSEWRRLGMRGVMAEAGVKTSAV